MLGLGFGRGWLRELGLGVAGGLALTTVLVFLLTAVGAVSLELVPDPAASLAALPLFFFIFTVAAALEEFIFRGYLLQALAEGSRRWIAGIALCVPFTWAHADNPDLTMIGVTNIFLAGVTLVVLYFQTRRLWLPIRFSPFLEPGAELALGFRRFRHRDQRSAFRRNCEGPDIVTGGEFGLEGSILSTVAFVLLLVFLWVKKVLAPNDDVAAMWASVPAGFGLGPVASGGLVGESPPGSQPESNEIP